MKKKDGAIGKRLKELRKAAGLTQQNVADILGVDRTAYTLYETGKNTPPVHTCIKLSDMYAVTVGYLLGTEEMPEEGIDYIGKVAEDREGREPVSREEAMLIMSFRSLDNEKKELLLQTAIRLASLES